MAPVRAWLTLLALTTQSLLNVSPAFAANVDATRLSPISLPPGVNCKQIFFGSPERKMNKALYMMPPVVAGAMGGAQAYAINEIKDSKNFLLVLHFYFPESDSDIESDQGSTYSGEDDDCYDRDFIRNKVNYQIDQSGGEVRDHYATVDEFFIQSVEISMPGFRNKARIGRALDPVAGQDKPSEKERQAEEVDILAYKKQTLTAIIEISADEKDVFERQVLSAAGMPISVILRFQGSSQDGAVTADLDMKSLSAAITAQAKGQVSLAKVSLATDLRAALQQTQVVISGTAGKSDLSNKVEMQVIEMFMKRLDTAAATVAASTKDANNSDAVEVSALISAITEKVDSHLSFNQTSAAEVATAEVPISLHVDSLYDPNTNELDIAADYRAVSTGYSLKKGESITIHTSGWKARKTDYSRMVKKYLSKANIEHANLAGDFEILTNPRLVIEDQQISGRPAAFGKLASGYGWNYPGRYQWYQLKAAPKSYQAESALVEQSAESYAQIPVGLSFSALGTQAIPFSKLMANKHPELWSIQFDDLTGRVILTANRDLGYVKFVELMHKKEEVQKTSVVLKQIVQEYRNSDNSVNVANTSAPLIRTRDYNALTYQKLYRFTVGRPAPAETYEYLKDPSTSAERTAITSPDLLNFTSGIFQKAPPKRDFRRPSLMIVPEQK